MVRADLQVTGHAAIDSSPFCNRDRGVHIYLMNAKGVVVGPAVAVMLGRENIVTGRNSGEIQWNGQSRLLILYNRSCSGVSNGLVPFPIPSDGDRVEAGFAERRQYQGQINVYRRQQKRWLIILRTPAIGAMAAKIKRKGSDSRRFRARRSPGGYLSQKKTDKQTCAAGGGDHPVAEPRLAACSILRTQIEELWQAMATIDYVLHTCIG
jgi:hypothetical protein